VIDDGVYFHHLVDVIRKEEQAVGVVFHDDEVEAAGHRVDLPKINVVMAMRRRRRDGGSRLMLIRRRPDDKASVMCDVSAWMGTVLSLSDSPQGLCHPTCFFLSSERVLPVGFCPLGVVYRKAGFL
jgi:hypothetical protein